MSDSSLLHAVAGAGAGCASLLITYPLYSRMVRQQVESHAHVGEKLPPLTLASSNQVIMQHLKFIFSKENLDQQFAGLNSALSAITVQSFVYYFFFQFFKNVHGVSSDPIGNLFVGSEAGVATVLATNPMWVINARQITRADNGSKPEPSSAASGSNSGPRVNSQSIQHMGQVSEASASSSANSSIVSASIHPAERSSIPSESQSVAKATTSLVGMSFFRAFMTLLREEGIGGLYSGVGAALALVTAPALQFASYEYMKSFLIRMRGSSKLSNWDFFWLGMFSKILSSTSTYPIQSVKSQMQKDSSPYTGVSGFAQCIRDMANSPDGFSSFYRGLKAKILQTGMTSAFLFVIRERSIEWLTALVALWSTAHRKQIK